jgi:hypothetical protein
VIEFFPSHGKWFAPPISDLIRAGVLKDAPCQRNAIEPHGGWEQYRVNVQPSAPSRRGRRCISLLTLAEDRKPGCSGWNQRWTCERGLPAVPGGYCQTCDQFEDDGAYQ